MIVVDANVAIALCSHEPGRAPVVAAALSSYAQQGRQAYAPAVIAAEALYVLCRKRAEGVLTPDEHARAVAALQAFLSALAAPPVSDLALAARADALRGAYGCSRSADGLYLALAEFLAQGAPVDLITFDVDLARQAEAMPDHVHPVLLHP